MQNAKINLSDLYGDKGGEIKLPASTGTEQTKTPVDFSDLYGEHGGLVAPPSDVTPEDTGKLIASKPVDRSNDLNEGLKLLGTEKV